MKRIAAAGGILVLSPVAFTIAVTVVALAFVVLVAAALSSRKYRRDAAYSLLELLVTRSARTRGRGTG